MKFPTIFFCLMIGFCACQDAPADKAKLATIAGDWRGVHMTVNNQTTSKNPRALFLRFGDAGEYKGNIGDNAEVGTFRMSGDDLYFSNRGQKEVKAMVQTLTPDSLVLELTHHEFPEKVTFIRRF